MCSREETKKIVHEEGGAMIRKLTMRFGIALIVTVFGWGVVWANLNNEVAHNTEKIDENHIKLEIVADKQNNVLVSLARIETILIEIQRELGKQ